MGLTNSCDVSTTTFTIRNNKLVKKGEENSLRNANDMHIQGSDGGAKNLEYENSPASHSCPLENHQVVSAKRSGSLSEEEYGSEDHMMDQRAAKRVRKPTKRYIEELSEGDSRDHSPKVISSAKTSGQEETCPTYSVRPLRNVSSNERTIVTRLDSLGGSGVQVPYVSRVRRSRPRKNIMALMVGKISAYLGIVIIALYSEYLSLAWLCLTKFSLLLFLCFSADNLKNQLPDRKTSYYFLSKF